MTALDHRSLPPLVDGDVYGHLTVTIDEVLWTRKHVGEVTCLLKWWGENESIGLRPADISKFPDSAKYNTSVTYNIRTSLSLFQTYLKQYNKLKLFLINKCTEDIIGLVEICHLQEIITGIQYQKYFPITTSSGKRIGDLRVDFDLNMNAIPEETSSKKIRKRSKRKNKSSSFRLADEEQKSRETKKGCKTCSDLTKPSKRPVMENSINLETPADIQAPPNTERSDSSDCVLLKVLEKGKKLRDAMVLSVLEDSPSSLDEELFLKLDPAEKKSSLSYKTLKTQRNGEIVTPREEKLISDYLQGKTMKEEEEILVLNTLHAEEKEHNLESNKAENISQKSEACCLTAKSSLTQPANDNTPGGTTPQASSCFVSELDANNDLLKRVNCFRLMVDSLSLTAAGWRKINQAVDNKSKTCDAVPPPGATYFIECQFVEDSPRTQAQPWKSTPLRFCSRRQIENVVYFGQSSAHSLRPPYSLANTQSELAMMSCLVCWRHLNQRVPALLGHFSLASVLPRACLETTLSLPVTTDTDDVVAHLRITLQLGRDKLYFGQALLEDTQNSLPGIKKLSKINVEDKLTRIEEASLHIKDITSRSTAQVNCKPSGSDIGKGSAAVFPQTVHQNLLPNYVDIPVCTNCGQNMVLTNVKHSWDSSVCGSCTNFLLGHFEPNFKISIPKNFATKEHRRHEFLLGIDTVIGFPLLAGVQDELSCYVDYKFPEITSRLKAEMGRSESTSRVVGCEQPSFSSVHRHSLLLPVVLPLSPLLASCSPGITLRLWLRYYRPTPRDHMVAMALLPMDELCLMELEFDKKQQKSSVMKVLELPLAIVPSSVTAPYQRYNSLGVLRVTVTYSNHITPAPESEPEPDVAVDSKRIKNRNIHTLPSLQGKCEPQTVTEQDTDSIHADVIPSKITTESEKDRGEYLQAAKNRFWTGPFGKEEKQNNFEFEKNKEILLPKADLTRNSCPTKDIYSKKTFKDPPNNASHSFVRNDSVVQECSRPVMKEDFDVLAESLEQRFNQLQSDLMKEKHKGLAEVDNIVKDTKRFNYSRNDDVNNDFQSCYSLSSNSSMESLPFILGPPADFKDIQKTVMFSKVAKPFSDSQSDRTASDTISGFLKEEEIAGNLTSNDTFDVGERKPEPVKPKTFKAKIRVDRAVNLKAVKTPTNGKKGKAPPSCWVSFGTGDCCERNCGTGGLVCSGQRFTTPVVRRNFNPIWNLTWDIDLPVDYLLQVNKRLVFRVFEENLDAAFGFASANLSILTSGLPCLSSWLSINDLAGACKGQIKVVVTPLEDLSQYQDCSVFDAEEDDFEESKEEKSESVSSHESEKKETASFVASQSEIFLNKEGSSKSADKEVEVLLKCTENADNEPEGEDQFSVDDVISDYKNTLENNFRNEMAGLENLIRFLRVGSMSNELWFLGATENKENLSTNSGSQHSYAEARTVPPPEIGGKLFSSRSTPVNNQTTNQICHTDRTLTDASTETSDRGEVPQRTTQASSEDILSKLLQQISMFQLPTVKITDNTSQTATPETKETFTETVVDPSPLVESRTVQMRDASTETDDIRQNRSSQTENDTRTTQPSHICGELGSVLLQHFLTCRPAAVKVTESSSQTINLEKTPSDCFVRSQPSGMSTEILKDNSLNGINRPEFTSDWISSARSAQNNSKRLIAIDNNIKDLERFLKENLHIVEKDDIPAGDLKGSSSGGSLNGIADSVQVSLEGCSRLSSDVESLGSCSQFVFPRETPDGGNPSSVPDRQNRSNLDDTTETSLKRQGTFVVDKAEVPSAKEESEDERLP